MFSARAIKASVLLAAIFLASATQVRAGFQVLNWELSTFLIESAGNTSQDDGEYITTLSNPLQETRTAQIGDNLVSAAYDHSWIEDLAWGDFNMSFDHQIRTPEVRTISISAIYIIPSSPVSVSFDGQLDYSHTPGDLDSLNFFASVRDESTLAYAVRFQTRTGELYFQPPSGSIPIHGEAILAPGVTYRLRYGLDSDNLSDSLPTGTLDASGYVNFSIRPVPEPASLLLIASGAIAALRRTRIVAPPPPLL
ncbi:MAG: PEP-CTERM sorting domain-containing protein [Phycisphaerales bacterium]|nr:PEP-CTERM sorting domain-containing protein [Phycisphaerales bacterium]MCB9863453.1 PEP-CTERM sorting domain-containing protein [Phycisphaerales bacterium]